MKVAFFLIRFLSIILLTILMDACKKQEPSEVEPIVKNALRESDEDMPPIKAESATRNLTSGLVAYFPFNGNAKDASGNNNYSTVYGANLTADRFGKPKRAYQFDGIGAYILSNVVNIPLGKSPRTASVWVNPSVYPGDFGLTAFAWGKSIQSQANMLGLGRGSIVSYQGWADDAPVTYNYPISKWFHIVTTFDGINASIYINGKLIGTSQKTNWDTASGSLYIGTRIGADLGFFNGSLDEIRIYNRVLSRQEISQLYQIESLK